MLVGTGAESAPARLVCGGLLEVDEDGCEGGGGVGPAAVAAGTSWGGTACAAVGICGS